MPAHAWHGQGDQQPAAAWNITCVCNAAAYALLEPCENAAFFVYIRFKGTSNVIFADQHMFHRMQDAPKE